MNFTIFKIAGNYDDFRAKFLLGLAADPGNVMEFKFNIIPLSNSLASL